VQEEEEEEEEEEETKAEPKAKAKSKGWGSNYLKPALANFMNADSCPRSEVVKEIWKHVKANDLQDPTNKQFIICDDRLMSLFNKKKIHMFKMNKELTKHFGERVGHEAPSSYANDDSDGSAGGCFVVVQGSRRLVG
jgi:upstream activation factor subunit UAF30